MALKLVPKEKYYRNHPRYLVLCRAHGDMLLARLKYLTFIGEIPEGCTIDHIDGNSLNNSMDNLRAVTPEINARDGGFLRKLRNQGINVAMYNTVVILNGYERMAKWKAEHTPHRYSILTRRELLQIFLGDDFLVDPRSSDEIMRDEMSRHQEL